MNKFSALLKNIFVIMFSCLMAGSIAVKTANTLGCLDPKSICSNEQILLEETIDSGEEVENTLIDLPTSDETLEDSIINLSSGIGDSPIEKGQAGESAGSIFIYKNGVKQTVNLVFYRDDLQHNAIANAMCTSAKATISIAPPAGYILNNNTTVKIEIASNCYTLNDETNTKLGYLSWTYTPSGNNAVFNVDNISLSGGFKAYYNIYLTYKDKIKYTDTFDSSNTNVSSTITDKGTESIVLTYQDAFPSKINVPVKPGYTFNGYWFPANDNVDFSTNSYARNYDKSKAAIATNEGRTYYVNKSRAVQIYDKDGKLVSSTFTKQPAYNVVFLADWIADEITVKLDIQEEAAKTNYPGREIDTTITADKEIKIQSGTRAGQTANGELGEGNFPRWWNFMFQVTSGALYPNDGSDFGNDGKGTVVSVVPKLTASPDPLATNRDFRGYFTEPGGVGVQYIDHNGYLIRTFDLVPEDGESSVTLYACWGPVTSTVTLDKNYDDANVSNDETQLEYGTKKYTAKSPQVGIPTRAGYTFAGYYNYTLEKAVTGYYYDSDGNFYTDSAHTPANAIVANEYTIYVDLTSGENYKTYTYSSSTSTYTYRNINATNVVTDKYYFDGIFYGTRSGSTLPEYTYSNEVTIDASRVVYVDVADSNNTFIVEKTQYFDAKGNLSNDWDIGDTEITLYAEWNPDSYKFNFDVNGNDIDPVSITSGSMPSADIDVTFADPIPDLSALSSPVSLPILSRPNYTFKGWYDNKDMSKGTKYYNTDGTKVNTNWALAGERNGDSLLLYAGWEGVSTTVTLNPNPGSGGDSSVIAKYGSDMPDAEMPSKTGSYFMGYYYDDVKEGYYYSTDGRFYTTTDYDVLIASAPNTIYIDKNTDKTYRSIGYYLETVNESTGDVSAATEGYYHDGKIYTNRTGTSPNYSYNTPIDGDGSKLYKDKETTKTYRYVDTMKPFEETTAIADIHFGFCEPEAFYTDSTYGTKIESEDGKYYVDITTPSNKVYYSYSSGVFKAFSDKKVGFYNTSDGKFYESVTPSGPPGGPDTYDYNDEIPANSNNIYIDDNKIYIYSTSSTSYIEVTSNVINGYRLNTKFYEDNSGVKGDEISSPVNNEYYVDKTGCKLYKYSSSTSSYTIDTTKAVIIGCYSDADGLFYQAYNSTTKAYSGDVLTLDLNKTYIDAINNKFYLYKGNDSTYRSTPTNSPFYVTTNDIVLGYYNNGKFYKTSSYSNEIDASKGVVYYDLATSITYRFNKGSYYSEVTGYYYNNSFYTSTTYTTLIAPETCITYKDAGHSNEEYRYTNGGYHSLVSKYVTGYYYNGSFYKDMNHDEVLDEADDRLTNAVYIDQTVPNKIYRYGQFSNIGNVEIKYFNAVDDLLYNEPVLATTLTPISEKVYIDFANGKTYYYDDTEKDTYTDRNDNAIFGYYKQSENKFYSNYDGTGANGYTNPIDMKVGKYYVDMINKAKVQTYALSETFIDRRINITARYYQNYVLYDRRTGSGTAEDPYVYADEDKTTNGAHEQIFVDIITHQLIVCKNGYVFYRYKDAVVGYYKDYKFYKTRTGTPGSYTYSEEMDLQIGKVYIDISALDELTGNDPTVAEPICRSFTCSESFIFKVDNVEAGYYHDEKFYTLYANTQNFLWNAPNYSWDSGKIMSGESPKIYVDPITKKAYVYSSKLQKYVEKTGINFGYYNDGAFYATCTTDTNTNAVTYSDPLELVDYGIYVDLSTGNDVYRFTLGYYENSNNVTLGYLHTYQNASLQTCKGFFTSLSNGNFSNEVVPNAKTTYIDIAERKGYRYTAPTVLNGTGQYNAITDNKLVVFGYYKDNKFYDMNYNVVESPQTNAVFIDISNDGSNDLYRYLGDAFDDKGTNSANTIQEGYYNQADGKFYKQYDTNFAEKYDNDPYKTYVDIRTGKMYYFTTDDEVWFEANIRGIADQYEAYLTQTNDPDGYFVEYTIDKTVYGWMIWDKFYLNYEPSNILNNNTNIYGTASNGFSEFYSSYGTLYVSKASGRRTSRDYGPCGVEYYFSRQLNWLPCSFLYGYFDPAGNGGKGIFYKNLGFKDEVTSPSETTVYVDLLDDVNSYKYSSSNGGGYIVDDNTDNRYGYYHNKCFYRNKSGSGLTATYSNPMALEKGVTYVDIDTKEEYKYNGKGYVLTSDDVFEGYYKDGDGKFYANYSATPAPTYTNEIPAVTNALYIDKTSNKTYRYSSAKSIYYQVIDDTVVGYYYNKKFYSDTAHTKEIPAITNAVYSDWSTEKAYIYDGYSYKLYEPSDTQYYDSEGKSVRKWDKTDGSATLYAKWVSNTYNLQLDGLYSNKEHYFLEGNDYKLRYGEQTPDLSSMTPPSKTGYTLAGLFDTQTGGTKYYELDGSGYLKRTTGKENWDKSDKGHNATYILYAQWTPKETTITFNVTGDSIITNCYYKSSDNFFYSDSGYANPVVASTDAIYVDTTTGKAYRYATGKGFFEYDNAKVGYYKAKFYTTYSLDAIYSADNIITGSASNTYVNLADYVIYNFNGVVYGITAANAVPGYYDSGTNEFYTTRSGEPGDYTYSTVVTNNRINSKKYIDLADNTAYAYNGTSYVSDNTVVTGYYDTVSEQFYTIPSGTKDTYSDDITGANGNVYIDLGHNKTIYVFNSSTSAFEYDNTIGLGYYYNSTFYTDAAHTSGNEITGVSGNKYIDLTTGQNNKIYNYNGSAYSDSGVTATEGYYVTEFYKENVYTTKIDNSSNYLYLDANDSYAVYNYDSTICSHVKATNQTQIDVSINGSLSNATVSYGSSAKVTSLSTVTINRDYYELLGWYDNEGNFCLYGSGDLLSSWNKEVNSLALYTRWSLKRYNISYDLGGGSFGSGTDNPSAATYYTIQTYYSNYAAGKSELKLNNPVRNGYTFAGWYLDADLTEKVPTHVDGYSYLQLDSKDMKRATLYAKWTCGLSWYVDENKTLHITYDEVPPKYKVAPYKSETVTDWDGTSAPWLEGSPSVQPNEVTKIVVESTSGNDVSPTSTKDWFKGLDLVTEVDLDGLDTTETTDMSGMFDGMISLTTIKHLEDLDTKKVTDMSDMFHNCQDIKEINVKNFVTTNVTDMSGMFSGCEKLEEVDVTDFVTGGVEDMTEMFQNCKSLEELDISNFETESITTSPNKMENMFEGTKKLTTLSAPYNDDKVKDNAGVTLRAIKVVPVLPTTGVDIDHAYYVYVKNNEKATLVGTDFVIGYEVSGWYTDQSCSSLTQFDFEQAITADITDPYIYAKMSPIEYSITYYVSDTEKYIREYNASYPTFSLLPPVKDDDVFLGWYENKDFSGTPVTSITLGTTGDKVYYAKWKNGGKSKNSGGSTSGGSSSGGSDWGGTIDTGRTTIVSLQYSPGYRISGNGVKEEDYTIKYKVNGEWTENIPTTINSYDVMLTHKVTKSSQVISNGYIVTQHNVEVTDEDIDCDFVNGKAEIKVNNVPDGVEYTIEGEVLNEPGYYDVTISFSAITDRADELDQITKTIIVPTYEVKDDEENTSVYVTSETGLDPYIELVVEYVQEKHYDKKYEEKKEVFKAIEKSYKIDAVYDVSLLLNGVKVQPNGEIAVKMKMTKAMKRKNFKILHIHGTDVEEVEYEQEGDYIVIKVDKLSEFAFVSNEKGKSMGTFLLILLHVIIILLCHLVYYFFFKDEKAKERRLIVKGKIMALFSRITNKEKVDLKAALKAANEKNAKLEAELKAINEGKNVKVVDEAEKQAKLEAERKAKEEAEKQAKLEAERKAKEEAEKQAKLEAERKAKEEAEKQAKLEAERKAKEEAEKQAKLEAERKAKEEAEKQAKLEAERKAKEEAEKQAILEAERKAAEEKARLAMLEAERKKEETAKIVQTAIESNKNESVINTSIRSKMRRKHIDYGRMK